MANRLNLRKPITRAFEDLKKGFETALTTDEEGDDTDLERLMSRGGIQDILDRIQQEQNGDNRTI